MKKPSKSLSTFKQSFLGIILICYTIIVFTYFCANTAQQIPYYPTNIAKQTTQIDVCFTPPQGCVQQITQVIDDAKDEIYVQAYGFTSQTIANSLVKAAKRGVTVKVLVDRTSPTGRGSKVHILTANGIEVKICKVPGIAHKKVLIIDKEIIVTGSYNFTDAAETRNAENVLIIQDPLLAKSYLQNWFKLQAR
jgi:phospholipase D